MKKILKILPYLVLLITDIYFKHKIESDYDKVKRKFYKTKFSINNKGLISLHKFHNYGLPFGFMKKYKNLVIALPLTITAYIIYIILNPIKSKYDIVKRISLSLIATGSISNIIDRLRYSYVVDYFSIEIRGIKKIIFNLGDIYIFMGSLIYILGGIFFG